MALRWVPVAVAVNFLLRVGVVNVGNVVVAVVVSVDVGVSV